MEGRVGAAVREPLRDLELRRGARLLALPAHRRLEAGGVDGDAALAADVGRQVEREAVGVVQLERELAAQRAFRPGGGLAFGSGAQLGQLGLEDLHAVRDGLEEAFLLLLQHVGRALLVAPQLRIGLAHLGREVGDQLVEERLARAELVAVPDRAPRDPAQHVAASLVARDHAVDDGERAGPDVVGDHLQRRRILVAVARAGEIDDLLRRREQGHEQIDLVVRVDVLQHRRQPLEAHAGVDARLRQLVHGPRVVAVELHEHVVPDLDVAVAILSRRSGRAAGDLGTVVVEDLAARPARAGVAHHPEVVGRVARALVVADPHDALGRQADLVLPDVVGLVVLGVDRRPELVLRQLVDLGQQLPRELQRVLLEVVAEREVAEHLEERVVARGVADVLEVVVLAAGADALLRRRRAHIGPLVVAEEDVLELVHPRVREQQGRVVAGHDRARGDDGVALRLEVLQERRPDLGSFHRGRSAGLRRFGQTSILAGGPAAGRRRATRRSRRWSAGRRFPRNWPCRGGPAPGCRAPSRSPCAAAGRAGCRPRGTGRCRPRPRPPRWCRRP